MSKEAALDHYFEPQEEHPKEYELRQLGTPNILLLHLCGCWCPSVGWLQAGIPTARASGIIPATLIPPDAAATTTHLLALPAPHSVVHPFLQT